jgi:uncharacterized DUF497 family protein
VNIEFEYDQNKSNSNMQKHGIDFEKTKLLFNDDLVAVSVSSIYNEVRFISIGKLDEKFYTVVYTYRESRVRIISTRRSRKDEEKIYEEYHSKRV